MMEPLISLQILGANRAYSPGDVLRFEFQVDAVEVDELQAAEVSVMWYTEGKGDEDLGVHFFKRFVRASVPDGDLRQLQKLETVLPNCPLSYSGVIVKICWCVRVRIFLRRGKELFFEQPFQLGKVPAVQLLAPRLAQTDETAA